MELFGFLMILVSIIIGLGVTEILSGVGRLLRARTGVRFYWIHVLFIVGAGVALLQQWWESWDLRALPEVTFLQAVVLLVGPIFLFLIVYLLFPDPVTNADLEAYYYAQAPYLWGFVVGGTIVGTFVKPWVLHVDVFDPSNLSGLLTIPLGIVLVRSKRRRVHAVCATAILVITVLDTVVPKYLISM